jgi:hypothetical protein
MPNSIKYSASAQTLALQKGNLWIGNGAVGKGPSTTTGYYNGVTPAAGGYTIYSYSASQTGNLSYFSAANDAALIAETNRIAGASYTTVNQCFNYYYTQTDRVCVSQDYPVDFPYIVLDGLFFYVDAGVTLSYPGSGTTWTDVNGLGPKNNGTLINGPTYNSSNGGSIVFDGVDDYSTVSSYTPLNNSSMTLNIWTKATSNPSTQRTTLMSKWGSSNQGNFSWLLFLNWFGNGNLYFLVGNSSGNNYSTATMTSNLSTSQYVNFSVAYNSGNIKMYRNGTLITEENSPYTSLKAVPTPLTIGADWDNGPTDTLLRYYNGNIAVSQIYNRALSSTEVLQNYNAQKSRFGL